MKIARLSIANFRGVKAAILHFHGHTLMVGSNNVGKSTICEALDLVLGPDRLKRQPPVDEFDFYNAIYLKHSGDDESVQELVPIRIEVVLIDLSEEVENRCGANVEFWSTQENRLLDRGEIDATNQNTVVRCLRLECLARYDIDEDDFEANTYYSHSPQADDGELTSVPRNIKNLFGFLYLRALRTGSRALSLEKGSLLDIILKLKRVRTGLWEKTIDRLHSLDIESDNTELEPVLRSIEERLTRYIPSYADNRATMLHVSQLTREHLRKTLSFFLAMSKDQSPVPFQHAGTGTLNTLVLALLTFIADLKPETVIFAMEEPEIAVPPHTQRRIVEYLLESTTQAFVTSHSPFVIERFDASSTLLLTRNALGLLDSRRLSDATGLKDYDFKRYARRGLTECMLGNGVIVVEGVTELYALPVAARVLTRADISLQPLDLAGVAFFDADGDGKMPKFGEFFRTLGLRTFGFYDRKDRDPAQVESLAKQYEINFEHNYRSFEQLLIEEMSLDKLWSFLQELRDSGETGNVGVPTTRPDDAALKKLIKKAFGSNKGAGWAARLFETCELNEIPITVVNFLRQVHSLFPKPTKSSDGITTEADVGEADGNVAE